jgi:hypothetical protein
VIFTQIFCDVPYIVPYVGYLPHIRLVWVEAIVGNYSLRCSLLLLLGTCLKTHWEPIGKLRELMGTPWDFFVNLVRTQKFKKNKNCLEINFGIVR